MKSRLYTCPRCGKGIKSTSGLTRHVNACKISIILPSCQPSEPTAILEDNTTTRPDLPSDKKGISPGISNHGEEEIKLAGNDNDDIRPANIAQ